MVFSSIFFLFVFLPVTLIGYYLIFKKNKKRQNHFLLFCSLFFYACGGVKYLFLMLFSIITNFFFARIIDKRDIKDLTKKIVLIIAITLNLTILFIYKYFVFSIININTLFDTNIKVPDIVLPIGISFFTFQAMSYVIDVYRGKGKALNNVLDVGLYISLFPQLIAGPIVRYEDIKDQLFNRIETYDKFASGINCFIIGLSKKVILADTLALVSEISFGTDNRNILTAWIGIIAYSLQIYFDFSGYSDMAIGLGKMFGFEFAKNFDYPYLSKTVTEFWRRWHISMGTWFRDYVYIPLGGSRVNSRLRYYFNLFVVWLLTGFWHGANWTFVLWGLIHLLALIIEKAFNLNVKVQTSRVITLFMRIYTLMFVLIGWVFFNSSSIWQGFEYIKSMFVFSSLSTDAIAQYLVEKYGLVILIALVCCFPIKKLIDKAGLNSLKWVVSTVLFVLSVVYIAKGSYSPFIYFNF